MIADIPVWIVLAVAGAAILAVVVPTLRNRAPPTPSGRVVRGCVAEALQNNLPPGVIYDLGSGWGGMARHLAKRFPDREVVGVESSPLPWLVSVIATRVPGPGNLRFRLADFRRGDLGGAAAFVCYLGPELSTDVAAVLRNHANGQRVAVSCFFALPDLEPVDSITARDLYRTPIYIYRM